MHRWASPAAYAVAWLAMLLAAPSFAQRGSFPEFTQLVKEASPAVVNISTTQKVKISSLDLPQLPPDHPLRDFIDRFRGDGDDAPPGLDAESLGSGFVISEDGHILTNNHVVQDAEQILVRLSDRREYQAKVVGRDERSDLALLKINAKNLPVVKLGRSSELEVGEWVLAIGSPFGFEHSATAGIVSAKGRSLPRENYIPFIQTDVAINPGNSGGPLFNLDGEVVGVNSQIYSRTGGFMGLSFSIPIELAMQVAEQLKATGRVTRGWLGVLIQDVTGELAESFGMSRPAGALVAQVIPGGPADRAGVKVGDVIVEYDGREVTTSAALPPLVGSAVIGKSVTMKLIRDGKPRTVSVKIAQLPDDAAGAETTIDEKRVPGQPSPQLGLSVDRLDKEQQQTLGVDSGVLVTGVKAGPAEDAGIAPGDVILMINQVKIRGLDDFRKAVDAMPRGKSVPVLVSREGSPRFLALKLPARE